MPVLSLSGFFSIPAKTYEHFTLTPSTAGTITMVVIAVCVGVILAALYNFYIRRVPGSVARLLLSRNATSPERAMSAEELELLDKPFSLWELLRGTALRSVVRVVETANAEQTLAESEAQPEAPVTEENAVSAEGAADAEVQPATAQNVPDTAESDGADEADAATDAAESDAAQENFDIFGDEEDEAPETKPKKKKAPTEPVFDAQTRFYIPEERKYRAEIRFEEKGNGVAGLLFTCALSAALGILLIKMIPVVLTLVDGLM